MHVFHELFDVVTHVNFRQKPKIRISRTMYPGVLASIPRCAPWSQHPGNRSLSPFSFTVRKNYASKVWSNCPTRAPYRDLMNHTSRHPREHTPVCTIIPACTRLRSEPSTHHRSQVPCVWSLVKITHGVTPTLQHTRPHRPARPDGWPVASVCACPGQDPMPVLFISQ